VVKIKKARRLKFWGPRTLGGQRPTKRACQAAAERWVLKTSYNGQRRDQRELTQRQGLIWRNAGYMQKGELSLWGREGTGSKDAGKFRF